MPVDVFAKWNQSLGDTLPLQSMERIMSGWKYAPVAESENATASSGRSVLHKTRDCLSSKAFLRTFLVLATILLLANLFSPARDTLQRYGWLDQDTNADGSSIGSEILDDPLPSGNEKDWSQYAYCQYVTNEEYLCNSLMIFESLMRLKAKAERLMLYPGEWIVGDNSGPGRLLAKARDAYGVRLMPIHVQHFVGDPTWSESFTKLLAFNQTQYQRVLSLDSDATVLQVRSVVAMIDLQPLISM